MYLTRNKEINCMYLLYEFLQNFKFFRKFQLQILSSDYVYYVVDAEDVFLKKWKS